jgi:hypothetical protein
MNIQNQFQNNDVYKVPVHLLKSNIWFVFCLDSLGEPFSYNSLLFAIHVLTPMSTINK